MFSLPFYFQNNKSWYIDMFSFIMGKIAVNGKLFIEGNS